MIQEVSMSRIVTTSNNPRKKIDQAGIQELADSINKQGLLSPIVVRLKNGKYEIVAGERRFLSCKLLNYDFIAADIRELTDREALECALAENMIRKDIHPMEEMNAFLSLIDEHGMEPEEIANRFGKSSSFIYKRIRLRDLCEDAKRLFQEDIISLSHCFELIKVSNDDQIKCLEFLIEKDHFDREFCKESQRSLLLFINENIEVKLSNASFKLDNSKLIPDAGPCTTCQFRSGFNKLLFNDVEADDICFNPECFKKKTQVNLDSIVQKEIKKGHQVVKLSTDWHIREKLKDVLTASVWKQIPDDHECDQEEKCTRIGVVVHGKEGLGSKFHVSIENADEEECLCLQKLHYDDDLERYTNEVPNNQDSNKTVESYAMQKAKKPIEEVKSDCLKKYSEFKASELLNEKLESNISPGLLNNKMIDLVICMYVKYMDTDTFLEIIKSYIPEDTYNDLIEERDEDLNAKFILDFFAGTDAVDTKAEFLVKCVIKDALDVAKQHWFRESTKEAQAPDLSKLVFEIFEIDLKNSAGEFKKIWDKFEAIPETIFEYVGREELFEFIVGLDERLEVEEMETIIKELEIDGPDQEEMPDDQERYEEELTTAIKEHFSI